MRKRQRHTGLAFTIVTAVFFVPLLALFFLLPTIDNLIGPNPAGLVPYDPIALWVEGWDNMISFNFASRQYMIIFVAGCIIAALMLFWLVAIIVKKQPKKLVFWFLMVAMCAATGFIAFGYSLGVCRTVEIVGGRKIQQHVFLDLLFQYGDLRLKSNPDIAPYVFYNVLTLILAYATLFLMAMIYLFSFLAGIIYPLKTLLYKEKPVEEVKEEPVEEVDEEALERERQRQELISYVEYKAGIQAREKEYEELCRANGIALEDDEDYYKRLARELPCLNEPYAEPEEDYYTRLARELPCLNGYEHEPEPKEETQDEYNERVAKDLAMFRLIKASQDRKIERYYREVIDELSMFGEQDGKVDAAASNLKRRAAEKRAYYERLSNELGCLQYQKPPVEPEVSDPDEK